MSETFKWCKDKTKLAIWNKQVFYISHRFGTKRWFLNGERHRENGTAVEYASGSKFWYSNGKQCYPKFLYWEELKK